MYEIYFADLAKATGKKCLGKRPVVVLKRDKDSATVLKITSRMRDDYRHVRMNNYVVSGFCNIEQEYIIDKKYLTDYKRKCTTSEKEAIDKKKKIKTTTYGKGCKNV